MKTDIVFTLGNGSKSNNDELRIALRSIARYAVNLGRIWIVSDCVPVWTQNVNLIHAPDTHKANKDANLFDKILKVANHPHISERFLFWSDDQVLLTFCDLNTIQPVKNTYGIQHFNAIHEKGKWIQRLIRTLEDAQAHGVTADHHCDTHTPQPHTKSGVKRALENCDYVANIGYCINTLIYGRLGIVPEVLQQNVKLTLENKQKNYQLDESKKQFLGYNDSAFLNGLRQQLFARFPHQSKFENNSSI